MNENEPSMKWCDRFTYCQKLALQSASEDHSGILAYWLWGNRHIEGMTLVQAFVRNTRSPWSDVKRKAQVENIHEADSSEAGKDGGRCYSSEEAIVMKVERRVPIIHF
jgi:hypothetical protein